jgi:MFS transporter, ACS family, allantoate permease
MGLLLIWRARYTKKTTVAAFFYIFYCAGNISGPQTFRPQDAPQYIPAEITLIVCYCVCAIDLGFLYWWLNFQNKKKAAKRAEPDYKKRENQDFLDMTDRENTEFVYVL